MILDLPFRRYREAKFGKIGFEVSLGESEVSAGPLVPFSFDLAGNKDLVTNLSGNEGGLFGLDKSRGVGHVVYLQLAGFDPSLIASEIAAQGALLLFVSVPFFSHHIFVTCFLFTTYRIVLFRTPLPVPRKSHLAWLGAQWGIRRAGRPALWRTPKRVSGNHLLWHSLKSFWQSSPMAIISYGKSSIMVTIATLYTTSIITVVTYTLSYCIVSVISVVTYCISPVVTYTF